VSLYVSGWGVSRLMTPNVRKPITQHQAGFEATLDLVEKSQEEHNFTAHDFDRLRFAFEDDGHRVGNPRVLVH
jgi:hypothetical protein